MIRARAAFIASFAIASLATLTEARAADPPVKTAAKIADASGTPVTFTSTRLDTIIWIAKGQGPEAADPFPYEKLGAAPLTVRLSPGVYTIETASESTSTGHQRIRVDQTPITIAIHPGDEFVKTLGGVFEGLGVTALVAGIIAAIVISPHDQNFPRWAIAIPAIAGGAGAVVIGVGLSAAGSTDFHLPSGSTQGFGTSFTVRF